jgi:hypothetical protein
MRLEPRKPATNSTTNSTTSRPVPGSRASRRWVVWLPVAAAIMVIGLIVWSSLRDDAAAGKAAESAPAKAASSAPLTPLARRFALPASSPQDSASQAPPPPRVTEVCGLGRLTHNPDGSLPGQLAEREAALVTQNIQRLRASGNERAQALAAMLSIKNASIDVLAGVETNANRSPTQPLSASGLAETSQLINLARNSRDPYVFALGREACRNVPSRCNELSAQRFAEIDPDNALAWLEVAAEAQAAGRAEQANGALFRAANANRFESYEAESYRLVQTHLPATVTALDLRLLNDTVTGSLGTFLVPGYSQAAQLCSSPESAGKHCAALVRAMAEKSDIVIGVGVAGSIARKIGLDAKTRDAIKERFDGLKYAAYVANSGDSEAADIASFNCANIARENERLKVISESSERGAAEQLLASSGLSLAEAARKYREHSERERERHATEGREKLKDAQKSPF